MPELPEELIWRHRWWVDPVPLPFFQQLEKNVQRQVLVAQLEVHIAALQAQIRGMEKLTGILSKMG